MASNEEGNSRRSSFTGSTSSKTSSFINIDDDSHSMASHLEIVHPLSIHSSDNLNSSISSSIGNAEDLSEVETEVEEEECEKQTIKNIATSAAVPTDILLAQNLHISLQTVFQKQDPKDRVFDIVFLIENKKIYAHLLIVQLCGATSLLRYIESNGSNERPKKVDMNTVSDISLTYDNLYILIKSIYFNNVGEDLTTSNVMLLLNLGKKFGIQTLICDCQAYLNGTKWEVDALTLLENANDFSDDEIAKRCLTIISTNTYLFFRSEKFLQIKHATLEQLLKNHIFQTDAKNLFDMVYEWTKNACLYKENATGETYRAILGDAFHLIPFEDMTEEDIIEIVDEKCMLTKEEGYDFLKRVKEKRNALLNNAKKMESSSSFSEPDFAAKLGSKITGFFKKGSALHDYPTTEVYEGPIASTSRLKGVDGSPLETPVSVYHPGRSDIPVTTTTHIKAQQKPIEPTDDFAKKIGSKITVADKCAEMPNSANCLSTIQNADSCENIVTKNSENRTKSDFKPLAKIQPMEEQKLPPSSPSSSSSTCNSNPASFEQKRIMFYF